MSARAHDAAAAKDSAATRGPQSTPALVQTWDLYPLKLPTKPVAKRACRDAATETRSEHLTKVRRASSPSPSEDSQREAANRLPSVQQYRSSPEQLQGRVTAALGQQLAALLAARLQERRREAALARPQTPPSDEVSSTRPTASREPRTKKVVICDEVISAAGAEGTPSETKATFTATQLQGAAGSGKDVRTVPHPRRGAEHREFPARQRPPHPHFAEGGGVMATALAGTYPGPREEGASSNGTASAGSEAGGPPPGAIELVRVHRLRGIPNHNRGLFAGLHAAPYTTRTGNMTLGVTGSGGKRVRPGAWGALWEHYAAARGAALRIDPLTGVSSTQWLARYEAQSDTKDGSQAHATSASSMVMRSFGSDGRTFFQWVPGSTRSTTHGAEEGPNPIDADAGKGLHGTALPTRLFSAQGSGLPDDISDRDIDAAIDRVVSKRYATALTPQEREEALRRLRVRREGGGAEATSGTADGTSAGWGSGKVSALTGSDEEGDVSRGRFGSGSSGNHKGERPSTGRSQLRSRHPHTAAYGSDLFAAVTDPFDGDLVLGQLAIPAAASSSTGDGNRHTVSTPQTPWDPRASLDHTLTVEEAQAAAKQASQFLQAQQKQRSHHRKGGKDEGDDGIESLGGSISQSAGSFSASRDEVGSGSPPTFLPGTTPDPPPPRTGDGEDDEALRHGRPQSASITMPNLLGSDGEPLRRGGHAQTHHKATTGAPGGARAAATPGISHGERGAGDLTGEAGGATGKGKGKGRTKRMRRRADGTLETLSDEDGEAEREDGRLSMFLANFPESEEHVRLRRQANNILAGLEDFGDDSNLPLPSFNENSGNAWHDGSAGESTSSAAAAKRKKEEEPPVNGFRLNEDKLREKFRAEAEVEYADLVALRDKLREDVARQKALKEAFAVDVHRLSEDKVGDQYAVELTREVNAFAQEHGLSLRQIVQDDALMEGDIQEVAEGFLDRFWKGKVETRDVGTQVADEDLGYVDDGVRTVEAYMQDLFYHENGLLTAIKLATVAVANIMSFHASLELESTCKECFFLFDRPRTLWPCGHTFCQQCLAGMYNHRDELICAECGSVCEVGYTPNLSVELISNYQVVQGSDVEGGDTTAASFARRAGSPGPSPPPPVTHGAQNQTVEGVLRTLLADLAATQRSCSTMRSGNGMLPVERVA